MASLTVPVEISKENIDAYTVLRKLLIEPASPFPFETPVSSGSSCSSSRLATQKTGEEGEGNESKKETFEIRLEAVDLLLSKLATRSSGVGSWYWPLGSKIVWSDENYKLFEKTREEFTGEWNEFESFVFSDDRNLVKQWLEELFQRLIPIQEPTVIPMGPRLAFRIYRRDGSLRWVEAKGQCYVEKPGTYHLVGINSDITQQLELDNRRMQIETLQARIAEQTKFRLDFTQFVDSITHELRNPMHGVLGNLEILEDLNLQIHSISNRLRFRETRASSPPPPDDARTPKDLPQETTNIVSELDTIIRAASESLAALKECVCHQKDVLDDSLLLSKLDSVKVELKPEWTCLLDVGECIVRMYRHTSLMGSADKRDVRLRLVFQDPNGESIQYDSLSPCSVELQKVREEFSAWVDCVQLKTILSNLLSNALKFTEEGSVVVTIQLMESRRTNVGRTSRFRFSVQDTGIGIEEESILLLFERFRQLPNTNQNYGGSGLGLCICDRVVKLFDPSASIQVSSKKGEGSCFSFELSFQAAPPSPPSSSLPTAQPITSVESEEKPPTTQVITTTTTETEIGKDTTITTTTTETKLDPEAPPPDQEKATTIPHRSFSDQTFIPPPLSSCRQSFSRPVSSLPILPQHSPTPSMNARTNTLGKSFSMSLPDSDSVPNSSPPVQAKSTIHDLYVQRLFIADLVPGEGEVPGSPRVALALGPGQTLVKDNPKAVICEDNAINARMLQKFCQQKGFDTIILKDGRDAIDFFEALMRKDSAPRLDIPVQYKDVRVVFLDILMPFFSGFDVAKRIRGLEKEHFFPSSSTHPCRLTIIGLSGHGRLEHKAEAMSAGFDELLSKPVSKQVILEWLAKCYLPRLPSPVPVPTIPLRQTALH